MFGGDARVLPPGLVSCVTGGPETGQALVRCRDVHAVAFTGGVAAARAVNVACAERLKPPLGGLRPSVGLRRHRFGAQPREIAA